MQGPQIFGPLHHAAAAGQQLAVLLAEAGGLLGFFCTEAVLALGGKDVRDAAPVGLDDRVVQIHEGAAQLLCQQFAQRGLAGRRHADEGNVQRVPAQGRCDAPDLGGGVLEFAVQEIFGRIHGLCYQHLQTAYGHRNPGFFGPEDEFRFVGIVYHVHYGFQPGHGGHIQIAHPHIGVHAGGGGVDDDLCTAAHGFRIAQLARFRVRMAADREHLCGTLVPRHGAGGVVGAAGAKDEHRPACKVHAVGVAQVGKAEVIGVVPVQQAVLVHHGVHGPDGLGPGVDVGAVFHDQFLVGDGHVDGPELPLGQKGTGLFLGGQGAQVVFVAAEHLVDDLGVGVAEPCPDKSVFHISRPPCGSWWGGSSRLRRSGP